MIGRLHLTLAVLLVALLSACTTLPPGADFPRTVSSALAHPEQTRLGRHFAAAAREQQGKSGFRIIRAGTDGFVVRMQMINSAEKTLDLQYFIFRGDETGRLLSKAVTEAADRGVRVRILVDDGETEPGDEQITGLTAHRSVEIRIFNPFTYRGHASVPRAIEFAFNASRLDYRMHNKLLVVDNAVALVGGRNIGDQYFQIDPKSQFADEDILAAGPVARQLSATFDEYWNDTLSIPAAALAGENSSSVRREPMKGRRQPLKTATIEDARRAASGGAFAGLIAGRTPLIWAHAEVVCDSPDKKKVKSGARAGHLMQRAVADAAAAVQSELLMITPYLIPGSEGMQLLDQLRQRKVRVGILTNSLESSIVPLAQAGYMHYRMPLLEMGVELYEIRSLLGDARGSGQTAAISRFGNYSLHAKLFVFDRQRLFIGSMNFDQRSMHLNTEVGLIIDSRALAEQVAARFEAMTRPANSYRLTLRPHGTSVLPDLLWHTEEDGSVAAYDVEPARSDAQRVKARILSLLPLDQEL